jgi:hypothetical protein
MEALPQQPDHLDRTKVTQVTFVDFAQGAPYSQRDLRECSEREVAEATLFKLPIGEEKYGNCRVRAAHEDERAN